MITRSQNDMVLDALRRGPLTQLDAYWFGVTRLAARIYDLRQLGYKIETVYRHENGRRFASYYLLSQPVVQRNH